MGLMRLWWGPEGMTPDRGAYVPVRPHRGGGRAGRPRPHGPRRWRSARTWAPVDPWIRDYLRRAVHILGTSLLWFARESDGTPLQKPATGATIAWRRWARTTSRLSRASCPASEVTVRAGSGAAHPTREAERKESDADAAIQMAGRAGAGRARSRQARGRGQRSSPWRCMPTWPGLPPRWSVSRWPMPSATIAARRALPGTYAQYPNWRIPLCDGKGEDGTA